MPTAAAPSRARSDADPLARLLKDALRHRPRPLLHDRAGVIPGASIWTGARAWRDRFRGLGLAPGDRVALALPPGRAFLLALLGAWRAGLAVCPLEPADAEPALPLVDARLLISADQDAGLSPDPAGIPAAHGPPPRQATHPPAPDLALILSTSGSLGAPRRVAISRANVLAQLESHTQALAIGPDDVALSVLPWRHAFGLLVDALPALLSGATLIVDAAAGRNADAMRAAVGNRAVTRVSMVPLQIRRWLETPGGDRHLESLRGGVVGGAAVREDLAQALARTNLRAGYGLTEASPGVCLGEPGDWREGWLGSPLGCETRVAESGDLQVRGPNVCVGIWSEAGLRRERTGRWLATGDLVEPHENGYVHRGRADHRFKLENGLMIDAPAIERDLRRALPPGAEPVVTTTDGRRLLLIVPPGAATAALRAWPRPLPRPRLCELALAPADLTGKGEVDRRRIAARLALTEHAA